MYGSRYPMQQPYYGQMQRSMDIIRVNGIEGARAYPMPPNSTAAAFDSNRDIMYIISTDSACFPSIRKFSFSELKDEEEKTQSDSEYSEVITILNEIKEMLSNGKQSVSKPARKQSAGADHEHQKDDGTDL